jgi:hypothetical protein
MKIKEIGCGSGFKLHRIQPSGGLFGRLCNEMLGYTAQYELLLQCGVNVLKLVIVLYWTWSASTFIFQKLLSPLHQAKV